jgi:hypothetical protein
MPKAAIASKYTIEYTIPGVDESIRKMDVTARYPLRELARFKRVNPKASVVRMYDIYSKTSVDITELSDTSA